MPTKFYPSILSLVKVDNIPEQLGFVKNGLSKLLDNIYFKDLQFSKNARGDSAFYSLSIVSLRRIEFDIPGTGIALVLNPSHTLPADISEFPVTLSYEWGILGYVRQFNLSNFSFKGSDFYDLALKILNISETSLVNQVLNVFIPGATPINQFVDDVNTYYDLNNPSINEPIPYPTNPDPILAIKEVINSINNNNQLTNVLGLNTSLIIFSVFLLDAIEDGNTIAKINSLFSGLFAGLPTEEYIKKLITPKIEASLQLGVGIEFPRSMLIPLTGIGGTPLPDPAKSMLTFVAAPFTFSTETGIGYDINLAASLVPSQIGNTGFEIAISNAKLDISRTVNIPEADLDGRPRDFVGVYIQDATIKLPQFMNQGLNPGSSAVIKGRNLLMGTGGISGTIGLEAINPLDPNPAIVTAKFGSFEAELNSCSISFHQNAITESNIKGTLRIPGFKDSLGNPADIDIRVHIESNGDFKVTASEAQGFKKISIPQILELTINSISIGRESNRFFLEIAGLLDFIVQVPGLSADSMPKGIDIKKIIIWDDGQVEIEGGTLELPDSVSLKIGPVELSITAIGLSSYENNQNRKYKVFEFSGGVSINPGGVDVRGEGVQLFFTNDGLSPDDFFIRIKGIGIDLIIPGSATKETAALIVKGFLSMKNPETNDPESPALDEYTGGVDFTLPKAKMSGTAAMRLIPKLPAFIIDIGLELSNPIPLGSTGLGIYGFRGLVGQRYVASKTAPNVNLTEQDEWWRYYKIKVAPDFKEGIQVSKFDTRSGFSIGAGVSLATTTDTGKSLSTKLFLLLSLPEVFLFQGQAALLKERIGLDTTTDPPFFALIAITSKSVEAAFGVNYKTPEDTGEIAIVNGIMEMGFFFGNSGAWYINVGKDQPVDRRIQARIASLFNAYAYLMLSSAGLRAGAGASWEFKKGFGPVGVELGAYIDVAGRINFFNEQPNPTPKRHVQLGGSIQMGGYARVKVFKFKFGFVISASLTAEAPKPFVVTGSVAIAIDLPKPFKDIDITVDLTWTFIKDLNEAEAALMDVEQILLKQPAKAVNILTKETFTLFVADNNLLDTVQLIAVANALQAANNPYSIPMDSRIDIEFFKGVLPVIANTSVAKFGGFTTGAAFTDPIPPQKGKFQQVIHEYRVVDVKILSLNGNTWVPYDIFLANTTLLAPPVSVPTSLLNTLKYGYWQMDDPNGNPKKYTKLSVLAQDPLTYLSSGSGGLTPEDFGINPHSIFCPPVPIEPTCVDFEEAQFSVLPVSELKLLEGKLLIQVIGKDGQVLAVPQQFGLNKALLLKTGSQLEMFFSQPVTTVELHVTTKADFVKISYFARQQKVESSVPVVDSSLRPVYEFQLVQENTIPFENLNNPVVFNNISQPIDKVVITSGTCTPGNLVCDPEITDVASELETFLNTLAVNDDLTKFNFSLSSNPAYQTVFCNTELYTGSSPSCAVSYSVDYTPTILNATLSDMGGFLCHFSLEVQTPSTLFDWTKVKQLHTLQHDGAHAAEGAHYDFLITAEVQQDDLSFKQFVLKGKSDCWPILFCRVVNFLLQEDGDYLLQEDDGRIIIDEDDTPSCSTLVYEICWLTLFEQLSNDNAPDLNHVQNDNDAMIAGINKIVHPVWRPHTLFAIQVQTQDKLSTKPGSPNTKYHTFGFRTTGTIGYWHEDKQQFIDLTTQDREEQFKLSSLKHYVDYGKSYPNADGDLLNAKPLFYKNPVLRLFYVRDYVYSMLNDWGTYNGNDGVDIELETLIKDPIEPVTTPIAAGFEMNDIPVVPENISLLNNLLQNTIPCTSVKGPLNPVGINTVVQVPDNFLKPLKLYNALFNAKMKFSNQLPDAFKTREVHRYNFQTSRYATFKEQIESYILSSDPSKPKFAIFDINRAFDAGDITLAQQVVNNTLPIDHALRQQFAEKYDRLMDGALKMQSLAAAVTTEFNIIKDTNTNTIIGILIRNPEPFNDPKLPDDILIQTLSLTFGGPPQNGSQYDVIFSKDRAKAFISSSSLLVGKGNAFFTFRYFEFSGSKYIVADTQKVNFKIK